MGVMNSSCLRTHDVFPVEHLITEESRTSTLPPLPLRYAKSTELSSVKMQGTVPIREIESLCDRRTA